ncbi:hypothetical protein AAG570_004383 [Ranatra chinensis]|uniref:Uncharacterized protein n=1 Tax=Ranatra chinensis TaxID=642074 RepID=A0ABD0Y326_9HEMI
MKVGLSLLYTVVAALLATGSQPGRVRQSDAPWWSGEAVEGSRWEPTLRGAWEQHHQEHHQEQHRQEHHHHYYQAKPSKKADGDLTTAAALAALFVKLFLLKMNSLGILKLVILAGLFLIKMPLLLGLKAMVLFKALKVAKVVALAPLLLLLLPLLPVLSLLPILLLLLLPVPVLTPPAAAAGRRRREAPQTLLDGHRLMATESCIRRILCHLDSERTFPVGIPSFR